MPMRETSLTLEDGTVVGAVRCAVRLRDRMRGLLGRDGLPSGALLLLDPCGSIHTLGMRFVIDVLFLDRDWRVVGVRKAVPPGRACVWGGWRARRTLEACSGWLDLEGLRGARLRLSEGTLPSPHPPLPGRRPAPSAQSDATRCFD